MRYRAGSDFENIVQSLRASQRKRDRRNQLIKEIGMIGGFLLVWAIVMWGCWYGINHF